MKTAVSVPDDLFEQAEHLAKRLDISRSQLYQRALLEFVARHSPESITTTLDRVCGEIEPSAEPFVARATRRSLARSSW
jgi:predicted transcriptional regulator